MIRDYLPLLLHIGIAIGFAVSALLVSVLLGMAGHAATAIDNARLNQSTEREIIARRAVEADLCESNDQFRAAVDAVHGVLWTNTPEGRMEGRAALARA